MSNVRQEKGRWIHHIKKKTPASKGIEVNISFTETAPIFENFFDLLQSLSRCKECKRRHDPDGKYLQGSENKYCIHKDSKTTSFVEN